MKPDTFTTTFLTGSGRAASYVAQLCQYCTPYDKNASKLTIQGRNWRVLKQQDGFKTSKDAVAAASLLKA